MLCKLTYAMIQHSLVNDLYVYVCYGTIMVQHEVDGLYIKLYYTVSYLRVFCFTDNENENTMQAHSRQECTIE